MGKREKEGKKFIYAPNKGLVLFERREGSLVSRANFLGYLLRLWLRDRRSYVFLDGKRGGGGWEDIEASTCFVLFPRFEE